MREFQPPRDTLPLRRVLRYSLAASSPRHATVERQLGGGVMEQGHVNRFVDYLNTLRTQTEAGNAFCFHEARGQAASLAQFGLSPSATYTRTRLDRIVEDALQPEFPFRAILLTGDAGDGKTACCEQLATALY